MTTMRHIRELLQFWWVFLTGFIIRAFVIIRTSALDQYLPVKYTDIDYLVFSDASSLINQGFSPYDRSTFRYTPLLAYFLLPNATFHEQFGKWLFASCDILVSILIFLLLRQLSTQKSLPFNITPISALLMASFYLFNPLSINLSTRGSMDVLHITLLYISLMAFYNQLWVISGILYGLAVHLRIYPFVFCVPIFFTLFAWNKLGTNGYGVTREEGERLEPKTTPGSSRKSFWSLFCSTLFHTNSMKFIFSCILINIFLLIIFYQKFGFQFLYETYLFHIVRKDTRHNFSPSFLFIYLRQDLSNIIAQIANPNTFNISNLFSSPFFLPNLFAETFFPLLSSLLTLTFTILSNSITFILLGLLPLVFDHIIHQNDRNRDISYPFPLPIIFLLQSLWFVCKNNVITAQYFLWFMAFVPMYMPYVFCSKLDSQISSSTPSQNPTPTPLTSTIHTIYTKNHSAIIQALKFIASCLLWLVSELLWLATGFFVEVRGIGGASWILMNIASVWLYIIHFWTLATITSHVLGFESVFDALKMVKILKNSPQIQKEEIITVYVRKNSTNSSDIIDHHKNKQFDPKADETRQTSPLST
jgi:phosphatidylinositol glycan class M